MKLSGKTKCCAIRFLMLVLIVVTLMLQVPITASATNLAKPYEEEITLCHAITAEAAIVVDFESGDVLFALNPDLMLPPASMTKMMTLYLVYEAMENDRFSPDTRITVSEMAFDLSRDGFNTNVPLALNKEYSVAELIDAAVQVSAAGATLALVELVAGSRAAFIQIMNERVEEWGIDALFFSAIGGTTLTRMTPRAMSVITRNFIMRFPEILEITAKESITFAGIRYPSANFLLGEYYGIDGFKTGTSVESRERSLYSMIKMIMIILKVTGTLIFIFIMESKRKHRVKMK